MHKHVLALVVIFCGAAVAWFILAGTLDARTTASDSSQQAQLIGQWGTPLTQRAPEAFALTTGGKPAAAALRSSRIAVDLNLQQRRKGLLWYNLYGVRFAGRYVFRNTTGAKALTIKFSLPEDAGSYADLAFAVNGRPIDTVTAIERGITADAAPGNDVTFDVAYRSRGMESWNYVFKKGIAPVNDFSLTMTTDFTAIDFPPQTLLPVSETATRSGWRLQWTYGSLVTADGIGMVAPYPPQPGPLAQRITMWAPVALLFYFFVMLLITTLRGIDLHPVNYFLLACAFFAFHLLFAYLVDRVPLLTAFVICSLVSLFLTVTYLRLVAGWRFAAVESGIAQSIYLVLFSYALFNEGWSGLTITTGAIVTLFVAMQTTGRIHWRERLA